MKFSEVLEALRNGERLVNASLSMKGAFIVRQVPQIVPQDVVPKMTSLPESAKESVMKYGPIEFHDQVLIVYWDNELGRSIATNYIPTWFDIFREDWTIA